VAESFNVLIEPEALASSDHCPLLVELAPKKEKRNFVNFAHRGASEYMAENTVSSFCMGLTMGANGIETDVQITKDGVLVLFHDDTLARVTGREGEIADYTYEELLEMRVRNSKTGAEDVIIRFEDFLRYFGWRDLTFAIEIKKQGYEKEVLEMMDRFRVRDKSVITSFKFPCIERVKELRPDYKVGYLIKDLDDEKYENMKRIGCEQICPQAKYVTAEKVQAWRDLGFSVRAWGISDTELMKHACECGVDGMTVNFPDLLTEYLNEKHP
jgi:glycerophosphoryl diester phosphodiesterase